MGGVITNAEPNNSTGSFQQAIRIAELYIEYV
jgi:hypothetical protein